MLQVADPYRVLQVIPDADPEVVRAAYRALARKYHPDMGGSDLQMATLNAAWETVREGGGRALDDREQRTAGAGEPRSEDAVEAEGPPAAAPPRRSPRTRPGTILDFGRYAGLSLGDLAVDDPDYLEWLARTPIGHRLKPEIDVLLAASRPTRSRSNPCWPEHTRSRFSHR
jgi:curved DNA-binding protein CbpA